MYDKIKNPLTNRFVNVNSHTGKSIIQNYINVLNGGAHSMQTRAKSVKAKKNWKKIKKSITRSNINRVLNRIQQARINNNSYVGGGKGKGKGFLGASSPATALIIGLRMIAPIQALDNLPEQPVGHQPIGSLLGSVICSRNVWDSIDTPEEVGALAISALEEGGLDEEAEELEDAMIDQSIDDILDEVRAEEPGLLSGLFNWLFPEQLGPMHGPPKDDRGLAIHGSVDNLGIWSKHNTKTLSERSWVDSPRDEVLRGDAAKPIPGNPSVLGAKVRKLDGDLGQRDWDKQHGKTKMLRSNRHARYGAREDPDYRLGREHKYDSSDPSNTHKSATKALRDIRSDMHDGRARRRAELIQGPDGKHF